MLKGIKNTVLILPLKDFDSPFDEMLKLLSPSRQKELCAIYSRKKAIASICGELIVRAEAMECLGIKNENIDIVRPEGEKPFLKGFEQFNFNISHSKNYVAVAFSNTPVGVDIEEPRSINRRIAERFFSRKEREFIFSDGDFSVKNFFKIWTSKEACIKHGEICGWNNLCSVETLENPLLKSYLADDYVVTVCNKNSHMFDFKEIQNIKL